MSLKKALKLIDIEREEDTGILDLSNLHLIEIPEEISDLTSLRKLILAQNRITDIRALNVLPQLNTLDLSKNQIKEIKGLESLTQLKSLNLSRNKLRKIEKISALENLNTIDLSRNFISEIENLDCLGKVKKIALNNNSISKIEGLNNLSQLNVLYLHNNRIEKITGLSTLDQLRTLHLFGNQIIDIEELNHLTLLTRLLLNDNKIHKIKGLENLKQLHTLSLARNGLSKIEGLQNLHNLISLDLSRNDFTKIKGLWGNQKLKILDLSNNNITNIENLKELTQLKIISLNNNRISNIEGLEKNIKLKEVDFSSNPITEIKGLNNLGLLDTLFLASSKLSKLKGLEKLNQLTTLDLSQNSITQINELVQLPNLKKVYLSDNRIIDLSPLQYIESLESYDLSNNPIRTPPNHIWNLGPSALRNYYSQLLDQGTEKLYEAKLILVGEPGAGKTSLMKKLIDSSFQVSEGKDGESTLGINIEEGWEFPVKNNKERNFAANLWDFGGQVIQYLTHQFFLTPDALYVLVADDRKQHTNFPYWFEIIHLLGQEDNRPSPILVVLNENQHRSITNYDHAHWQKRYPNTKLLKHDVDLSETDSRFLRLQKAIHLELQGLHIVGDELPGKWRAIREELRNLSSNNDHITNTEFREICINHGMWREEDQNVLSGYLHKLGSILHYTQDPSLEDLVILNPQWAVDAVYSVLSNKTVEQQGGFFSKEQVYKIWSDYKSTEKGKLLNLMRQEVFEICYPVGTESFIAPQLLPTIRPEFEIDGSNALRFRFQYAFMPKGIMTRLIVRLHDWIVEEKEGYPWIWRTGAVFQDNGTRALIEEEERNEDGQSVIDITVSGEMHERKYLLNRIIGEVHRIHQKWFARIKIKEMIPCDCHVCRTLTVPHYYDFKVMKAYREKGLDEIMCEKSIEPQSISHLLEGVALPKQKDIRVIHSAYKKRGIGNPRADTYTLGNRERALINPGKTKKTSLFISYSKLDKEYADTLKRRLKPLARRKTLDIFYDQDLMAGDNFDTVLKERMATADLILLLTSPDSLATDYIMDVEVPLAQQQYEAGQAKVIPVILRPGDDWKDEPFLQDLNAIPSKGTPISSYEDLDEAWNEVVNKIKEVVSQD
ncbi:MAG TPA: hypothetical protein DCP28_32045 [Cytophagales bacterium]|nr:hypothetical protein [Cytophagales bacterium]